MPNHAEITNITGKHIEMFAMLTFDPINTGVDPWAIDGIVECLYQDFGTEAMEPISGALWQYIERSVSFISTLLTVSGVVEHVVDYAYVTDDVVQVVCEDL